ncbi:WD domain, G-beta repeat protein [Toxoplasma gondii]|uniref:WD domain, G-beta repeat protein n=1 Tax=Toxoplasma gondii TaxID=5811 RepID=A0A7J6KD81_TOXGO|nr:WD domain, G-beta repeat protein [Toxoplasma gondii]
MFLGLSNGTLMAWTDAFEPATSSDPQASSNGPTVMKAQGHSGAISSLVFLRTLAPDRALRDDCKKPRNDHPPGVPASSSLQAALVCSKTVEREGGFLFTGSADRNIKLWVVEQRKLVCVRTLCFHGGTVVSLAYCFPYLFSASTDGTALVCRAEQTSGSLKYPHFTVVERVFAHSIYHPSTKLVLSNKQAWYDSLAVRCNGDRICLYCGATDGSLLVLENTQTYVPAKPVVGSGGAPPVNLHTQERATVWSEARERASTAIGRGRLYSSLLCNTSCWGSISGPEVGEDVGYGYHGEKIPAGAASYARDSCGCLSFYNIYSKERVHSQQVTEHRIVSLSIATHERNVVVSTAHEVLLVEVIEAAEEVALTGHQGAVMHMLWQPTAEGGYMYSSADDTTIRQWDVQKGLCTRIIRHKYADITSWMLIDALNGFVTGHEDGDVRFWYLRDFSSFSIQNQKGHHIHINSVTGMCCWRPTSTAKPEDHKRSKVITNAEDDNASSNGIEHSRISPNVERDLAVTPPIYQVLTCGYDGRLNVTEIRADAETGEITTKIIHVALPFAVVFDRCVQNDHSFDESTGIA